MTEAWLHLGEPHLDRLTALDASNLRVEDHGMPMHVAALTIVDGAALHDSSGRLRVETIREHVERRTHLSPRLRQRLRRAPLAAGPPVWVDDPAFDIRNHVRVLDLSYPADEASMLGVCSKLNETPLDRSRPLWEMWLLTGRDNGSVALLIRMHHVVTDGIAALDILGALFDQNTDRPSPPASAPKPRPEPRAPELYADHLRRQGAAVWRAVSQLRRPGTAGRHLTSLLIQVRRLTRQGFAPRVSLNGPVGSHRRLILVRADLAGARAAARAHGAKVNDVVLAAMAGGARRLLESRGELKPNLVLMVSVAASLRDLGGDITSGNRVGVRIAPLPVCEPDAVRRLQYIASVTAPQHPVQTEPAQVGQLKSRHRTSCADHRGTDPRTTERGQLPGSGQSAT
ncbi:MAG TPA: wax ester/triacylglycerol synthase domain-containing protein [Dermatophilaceae bacterium]|nr:wax ester/triacylglycerol synthase domain-containing protein [Dermatophilaceae bacterium]